LAKNGARQLWRRGSSSTERQAVIPQSIHKHGQGRRIYRFRLKIGGKKKRSLFFLFFFSEPPGSPFRMKMRKAVIGKKTPKGPGGRIASHK